jgi:DNA-binding NarL/FixJ family response regulator
MKLDRYIKIKPTLWETRKPVIIEMAKKGAKMRDIADHFNVTEGTAKVQLSLIGVSILHYRWVGIKERSAA